MNDKTKQTECWAPCWGAFKNGDMDAFRQIYTAFFDKLYAYGSKLTNDATLLEDSIQELFLELYTKRKKLASPENLEYYLLKSLKLTIYQKHRKNGRFVVSELEEETVRSDGFVFSYELSTGETENETEKDEQLRKLLDNLDASQRELLYLKFYKRLTYKEIGHLLGVQPDSAKKQVYRIISRLKHKVSSVSLQLFYMLYSR
ncbi:sigma-70 family RNA polymerase sigma factor [uncultured Draconibacterium sp.]|uniref:RNA polymerase sigma factor n=1 Tax=uncultured Draconibacterium sp. TaxID=1573823 RepID=UPI0025E4BB6C|nr:sigma-70 family RNA polymerase sigma factor [uncultured Draconibacterium sp.]